MPVSSQVLSGASALPCSLCDILFGLIDGWHVNSGKEVAVHVVSASQVVNVSSIGIQIDGVIRDEVSIDNRGEAQVIPNGV